MFVCGKALTIDHKPTVRREANYVKSVNGYVSGERRVKNMLAVGRSVGDLDSVPAVSSEPDVHTMNLRRWNGIHVGCNEKDAIRIANAVEKHEEHEENDSWNGWMVRHSQRRQLNQVKKNRNAKRKKEHRHRKDKSKGKKSDGSYSSSDDGYSSSSSSSDSSSCSSASYLTRLYPPPDVNPSTLFILDSKLRLVLDKFLLPLAPHPSLLHDPPPRRPAFCQPVSFDEYFPTDRFTPSVTHGYEHSPVTMCPTLSKSNKRKLKGMETKTNANDGIDRAKRYCSAQDSEDEDDDEFDQPWWREDVAIVIGCDGVFDVVSNQLVAEMVCPWMEGGNHDVFNDPVFDDAVDALRISPSSSVVHVRRRSTSPVWDPDEEKMDMDSSSNEAKDGLFDGINQVDFGTAESHGKVGCRCGAIEKGMLAELGAVRLKSCADALESMDNISVIVIIL